MVKTIATVLTITVLSVMGGLSAAPVSDNSTGFDLVKYIATHEIQSLEEFQEVIGTITVCSIPLLAANKATFNPYYTGTGVGSVLTQTRGITATGTKYRAHCDWATSGCKITISFQSGPSTPKLGANQTYYLTRTPSSSGNINVTGSLSHGTSSGGVQAYIEKQY